MKNIKFVVNVDKNIFFSPNVDDVRGSVINFLSFFDDISLRDAAKILKVQFLVKPVVFQKEIPELELIYHKSLEEYNISEELAQKYEIGYVKQRSIMQGRIAFKIYDENKQVLGYVGWHPSKNDWLFPKNFIRPVYNINNIESLNQLIVCSSMFDCLFLISKGYISCVSLIAKSMTDSQENILKRFNTVILLHPEPDNIVNRLSKSLFIKAPKINFPLHKNSEEEIMAIFSHDSLSESPG
jgi:hypothetical protein